MVHLLIMLPSDPTGNLTITANTFNNTGGVVNADALTVSVAGDFDYGSYHC